MLSIDSFFKMGKDHKKCEDYVIHGNDPFPYVILSDGCSSCLHTDVGARILAHQLKNNLKSLNENFISHIELVLKNSQEVVSRLGLNNDCLNCTLLCIYSKNNKVYSFMIGDGGIIYKEKHKDFNYINHSFSNNTPFYINYLYKEVDSKNELKIQQKDKYSINAFNYLYMNEWDINDLEYILVVSDGLESLTNSINTKIFIEVIQDLIDFKNFNGSFIERKVKRLLKNYEKEGFYPSDDISVGGIYLGA